MSVERVKKGDKITADRQNDLIGALNRRITIGTTSRGAYGTSDTSFTPPVHTPLELFELTEKVCTPESCSTPPVDTDDPCYPKPPEWPDDYPDVPWSRNAKRVYLDHDDNTYDVVVGDRVDTIYWPSCTCAEVEDYGDGDRFHCRWNNQAARWEVVGRPGGSERKIPFQMFYDDCPAYGILMAFNVEADSNPAKLYCREPDDLAGFDSYRHLFYICDENAVASGESGLCSTGEHWPTLARGDEGLVIGDIVTPNASGAETDPFNLTKLDEELVSDAVVRGRYMFSQRYVVLDYGPDSVRTSSSSGEGNGFDIYWVQSLGIEKPHLMASLSLDEDDHPTTPHYKTFGGANAAAASPAFGWSANAKDIVGYSVAGGAYSYGETTLRLKRPGVWRLGIKHRSYVTTLEPPNFDVTDTTTDSGHYHQYDKWSGEPYYLRCIFDYYVHAASPGSVWRGQFYKTHDSPSGHIDIDHIGYLVVDQDTDIVLRAQLGGSMQDTAAIWYQLSTVLSIEWICPKL